MTTFRKSLNAYVDEILATDGEHKRAEIAEAFLDANPELALQEMRHLAERQVDSIIKARCNEEPSEQIALYFDGLPAAVAVAPGVVKAIEFCTPEDIAVGKSSREDNIRDARARLRRYAQGAGRYLTQRKGSETVGETQRRLTGAA